MAIEQTKQNDRIRKIVSTMVSYLAESVQPHRIILFGSRAKGTATMGSDIDLAVEGGNLPGFRGERKLREALDRLAGIYSVDLIFLNQVDEVFSAMVEESGKVVYEKD